MVQNIIVQVVDYFKEGRDRIIGEKRMFEKYITIKETNIVVRQSSSGMWYCSELPAHTTVELDVLIGEVNKILNKYNDACKKTKNTKETKLVPNVKGLL